MKYIYITEDTDHLPYQGSRCRIVSETDTDYEAVWSFMGASVMVRIPKNEENFSYIVSDEDDADNA